MLWVSKKKCQEVAYASDEVFECPIPTNPARSKDLELDRVIVVRFYLAIAIATLYHGRSGTHRAK